MLACDHAGFHSAEGRYRPEPRLELELPAS